MKKVLFSCLFFGTLCAQKSQNLEEIFTTIYQKHMWGGYPETVSGSGSTLGQTEIIREFLPSLFKTLNISSLLDAPCGDFNWMKEVDLSHINYIGMDIVEQLVSTNQKKYGRNNLSFTHGDVTTEYLPQVDLILCRDLFLHLTNQHVSRILMNFKKSGSSYLMASTYAKTTSNKDREQVTREYRPLNLQLPPFNLPEPMILIDEGINGKFFGLWRISDIPDYPL